MAKAFSCYSLFWSKSSSPPKSIFMCSTSDKSGWWMHIWCSSAAVKKFYNNTHSSLLWKRFSMMLMSGFASYMQISSHKACMIMAPSKWFSEAALMVWVTGVSVTYVPGMSLLTQGTEILVVWVKVYIYCVHYLNEYSLGHLQIQNLTM